MCSSTQGYVGQIPLNSQIGDVIFLPLGSAVPFIGRPQRSTPETYRLVGECYIHGIMEGQLLQSDAAGFREFVLV